jgi:hypothetical protein
MNQVGFTQPEIARNGTIILMQHMQGTAQSIDIDVTTCTRCFTLLKRQNISQHALPP